MLHPFLLHFRISPFDVFDALLDLLSNHCFLLLIEVIFFAGGFLLNLDSQHLSVHLVMLFVLVLLPLFVSPNPIILFYLLSKFIKISLSWAVFSDLPVGRSFGNDVVDFCPAIGFLFINQDERLSSTIGSSCSTGSVHIGVSVYWDSHLNDMSDVEVETSGCHVGSNKNVAEGRFFEFL